MSLDAEILRALLRLARRRLTATEDDVALRVRLAPSAVRAGLRRLRARGLVTMHPGDRLTLTLPGLAVAVASLPGCRGRVAHRNGAASRAA